MDIKDYIGSNNNTENRYIKYNDINIRDGQKIRKENNDQEYLTQEEKIKYKTECKKICGEYNDCDGLNIDDENSCGIIKKVDNRNIISHDNNNTSYVKKDLVKNYDNDREYTLKLGDDAFVTSETEYGQILLKATKNKKNANKFKFDKNDNIIDIKNKKCIQSNGSNLILNNCDDNDKNQKFIIENKLQTLRNDKNNCLTTNESNITLEECDNSLIKNNSQTVKTKLNEEILKEEENYESKINVINYDDYNDEENNSMACENNIYKLVINIIFATIVMILIYYIMNDDE
jgi:hypothetical protein